MKPAHPDQMRKLHDQMKSSPFIPAILAHSSKRMLLSYYGGYRRMLWRITADSCRAWWLTTYWRFVMWICDCVGWTKVVKGVRHGRQCDGLRCLEDDARGWEDCLGPSIPAWFKFVTRMEKNL